ncbi:MAG: pseudouridine synthase, partial [Myxococcota bacterium]|nr:pseudouridine synthase [Myxococcota bacterium]
MAERLQKYLARAGVASRRHAEELITAGKIQVNNKTVTELGTKVEPGQDLVTVEGRLVSPPDTNAYFILYKPVGVVTTLEDPQGRPTVAPLAIEPGRRLFPIGRLDYDAEGALLLTDDGELAHQLMHPKFQVPRTYLVKVKGVPTEGTLEKLRAGVRLEDGVAQPKQVEVYEKAEKNTWLMIVVAEGRPHLIKRLCAAIGHPVVRLYRPNYAGVSVEGLRPGDKRALSQAEIEKLRNSGGGQDTPPERAKSLKLPPRRHGRAGEQEGVSFDEEEVAPRKAAPKKPRAKTTAGTGTFRGAAKRPDEGAADADEAGGFINRKPRSETKGPGRPDNNEGGGFEERPARGGGSGDRDDRPARAGGFSDRPERPARAGGSSDRPERPARAGGFGDRAERPARGGFGDRPAREDRAGGAGKFGDRPARAGGKFGDRAGGAGKFGDRPARAGGKFGDRAGGAGKFGDRPARAGGKFGDRPPRGDRPERAGGFGDR